MRRILNIFLFLVAGIGFSPLMVCGQSTSPAPYCNGPYTSGVCMQGSNQTNNPQNGINDFIDFFRTSGGNTNITNDSSGCNMNPNNYALYCNQFLATTQGQTITCTMKSGVTFAQGFAIFIDWNQDNVFQVPAERVAATVGFPAAATWTTLVFVIPNNIPNGIYRMRVRCAFATSGVNITPCGSFTFGETEDYPLIVGSVPMNCTVITATPSVNSPLCAGQSLSLSVATNTCSGLTYSWSGPGNFTSTAANPVRTNATSTMSGTYSVIVSNSVCPITKTISVLVVPTPSFDITPSTPTICQGGGVAVSATFAPGTNLNQFSYLWTPVSGSGQIFPQFFPSTSLTPLPLPSSVTLSTVMFSITVTPTVHAPCSVQKTLTITIHNPSSPTLTIPQPRCNNSAPYTLSATPGGGTWTGHPAVNPAGVVMPALVNQFGDQQVVYSTSIGNCLVSNTGSFSVSKFNTAALSSSLNLVCEQDPGHNLMNLVQNTVTGSWSGTGVNNANLFVPSNLPSGLYFVKYRTFSQPLPICRDSSILPIQVFNPPVPVISPVAARCTNAGTINMQATPPGGTWSNNSAVSFSGVLTPSLGQAGTNYVTYVAGQGTCVASSASSFHISQFRSAAITGIMPHLCSTFTPVKLMGLVQNTAGVWSGTNVSNNIFIPSGIPTNTYILTYSNTSFPDPLLCPDAHTVAISVLNPAMPEIKQESVMCSKEGTIQLSVSPATGAWSASSYLTPGGVFIPSLAVTGYNAVEYVIGTSTCNARQTKFIAVEAFVPAILATNKLPDLCNTNLPVNLTPLAPGSLGTWSGTAVNGSIFDPSVAGAGNFTLSYHTTSYPSGLCPDRAELTVKIFSLALPVISHEGPFCDKWTPVQLKVSPVGGLFKGSNSGAISPEGLFNPAYAVPGDNIISYSISSGPCISFAQTTISVEKFMSAAFAVQPREAYCVNSQPFDLNSLASNPGGFWSGPGVTGSMFDPAKANPGNNNLIVYRTQSVPNGHLCPDSNSVRLKVDEIPLVNIVSSVSQSCAPVEVVFNSPNINSGSGEWYFGDGTSLGGLKTSHIYTSPGTYSVVFNYKLGACSTQASLNIPVKVMETPVADFEFSKDQLNISEPEVDLLNRTSDPGNNRYLWTVEGLDQFSDFNPHIVFPKTGRYNVTLAAINDNGCRHEITKSIHVINDFNVFIPNSFTPNADGLNDYFKPVFSPFGLDAKYYTMEIFDRWGHKVFSTTDVEKGWDGSLRNDGDLPVKQETYVYRIKFRDTDGMLYERTGYLLLIPE